MTKPAPELIALADAALEWIDAVPKDMHLPAMPGFDRDWANEVLHLARTAANQSGSERAGVDAVTRGQYVVRKGGYFYRPNAQGYTSSIYEAGLWPESEARKYADGCEDVTVHAASEFTPPAQPAPAGGLHPSHVTRSSDASTYDEVCINCGATDITGGGWGKLAEPCHGKPDGAVREELERLRKALEAVRFNLIRFAKYPESSILIEGIDKVLHSPKIAAAETSPGDVTEKVDWTPFEDGTAPWPEDEQFEERAKACKSRCKQYGYTCGQGGEEDYEYEGECDDCDRDAQEVLRKKYLKPAAIDRLESQAKALSEAEASWRETLVLERGVHLNEVRLKDEYRTRALAAEARLAEATRVIEPFINAVDLARKDNCYLEEFLADSVIEASRSFLNAAKEKT